MRKLFKKSLACVLAVALCLTAMVGVLTVSADTTIAGTIAIADVKIDADDTSAVIPVTFTIPEGADKINVGYINVAATGATITDIGPADATDTTYDVVPNADKTKFELFVNDNGEGGVFKAVANITVTFTAGSTFKLALANDSTATNTEYLVNFEAVEKEFIPEVACEHTNTTTKEEVTKAATCTEVGSKTITVTCECGEVVSTTTEEIPATDHAWGEGEVTTAPDCDDAGVKTFTCLNDASHTKTEAIDALGHTEVAYEDVEATCTTVGYTGGLYCSVCEAVIEARTEVPVIDHDFGDNLEYCAYDCGTANPNYVAGTPVDPELVIAGASMAFGTSSLEMNFRIRNSVLTLAKYDHVDLVIIPQKYDLTTQTLIAEPTEIVIPYEELSGTGTFRTYPYSDMMLYELALNIDYKLRGYDAEGNVLAESEKYTQSAVSYLKNNILNVDSSSAELKKVAVDMLVVCEEARIAMAKEGTDLERDSKVSVLEGVDLSLGSQEVGKYDTTNNFEAALDAWKSYTITPGVAMEKVPVVTLRIRDGKALDESKLSVKVSYTSAATSVGYVEKTLSGSDLTRSGSFITAKFTDVGLHDSNAVVSLEFIYDGVTAGTLTCSIEAFLGAKQSDATIGDLSIALIKLGASFRTLKGY